MATYYDEEERKKGGFWGKFLAVLLGFLFGIIATIGSIAAIGYALFAKIKIKDGISSVNKITGSDIDYKEYITDEYAEKTISALLSDLSSLVSEFQGGKGSLSSLNKISPQVETQVTKIADTLQSDYNIPLAVNSVPIRTRREISSTTRTTSSSTKTATSSNRTGTATRYSPATTAKCWWG